MSGNATEVTASSNNANEFAYLSESDRETQIEAMRAWFFENYQDPVKECPYDGREGGFQFIHGGPYSAELELHSMFDRLVPDDVINELISELDEECLEWSGVPNLEDYYEEFEFHPGHRARLIETYENIDRMLTLDTDEGLKQQLLSMAFVHAITHMEAFLSESFIWAIERDEEKFRTFVEKNKDFQDEKVPMSEIFQVHEELQKKVRSYLVDLLWHNLPKVKRLYQIALGMELPIPRTLYAATLKRHDLVHRAGKTKDGDQVLITVEDVSTLINDVLGLALFIEQNTELDF
jgi:hypothetical protein